MWVLDGFQKTSCTQYEDLSDSKSPSQKRHKWHETLSKEIKIKSAASQFLLYYIYISYLLKQLILTNGYILLKAGSLFQSRFWSSQKRLQLTMILLLPKFRKLFGSYQKVAQNCHWGQKSIQMIVITSNFLSGENWQQKIFIHSVTI